MEQGITKDGAVRCRHCDSTEVEWIRTASGDYADGSKSLKETYKCRTCKKKFSKLV